jgi:hypothetical protein
MFCAIFRECGDIFLRQRRASPLPRNPEKHPKRSAPQRQQKTTSTSFSVGVPYLHGIGDGLFNARGDRDVSPDAQDVTQRMGEEGHLHRLFVLDFLLRAFSFPGVCFERDGFGGDDACFDDAVGGFLGFPFSRADDFFGGRIVCGGVREVGDWFWRDEDVVV